MDAFKSGYASATASNPRSALVSMPSAAATAGRVEAAVQVGDFSGMIPSIEGDARIIGYNQLILDPEDPYVEGFQVI